MKIEKEKTLKDSKGSAADENKPLTEGKFKYYFEIIKDLIITTSKATETALRQEIQGVRDRVELTETAITEHSRLIKGLDTKVDTLDTKIDGVEKRLSDKIDGHSARFDDHESRIVVVEHGA